MGWVVNATPRPLYPRERPGTYCIEGWLSPRAGLDGYGKISPPAGFDPRTVQPGQRSSYTAWAIRDPCWESSQYSSVLKCEISGSRFYVLETSALPRCYAVLHFRGREVLSSVPPRSFACPDFACILYNNIFIDCNWVVNRWQWLFYM